MQTETIHLEHEKIKKKTHKINPIGQILIHCVPTLAPCRVYSGHAVPIPSLCLLRLETQSFKNTYIFVTFYWQFYTSKALRLINPFFSGNHHFTFIRWRQDFLKIQWVYKAWIIPKHSVLSGLVTIILF